MVPVMISLDNCWLLWRKWSGLWERVTKESHPKLIWGTLCQSVGSSVRCRSHKLFLLGKPAESKEASSVHSKANKDSFTSCDSFRPPQSVRDPKCLIFTFFKMFLPNTTKKYTCQFTLFFLQGSLNSTSNVFSPFILRCHNSPVPRLVNEPCWATSSKQQIKSPLEGLSYNCQFTSSPLMSDI